MAKAQTVVDETPKVIVDETPVNVVPLEVPSPGISYELPNGTIVTHY